MSGWIRFPSDSPVGSSTCRRLYSLPDGSLSIDWDSDALHVHSAIEPEDYVCHIVRGDLEIRLNRECVEVGPARERREPVALDGMTISDPERFQSIDEVEHYLEAKMRAALQRNVEALGGTVCWPEPAPVAGGKVR